MGSDPDDITGDIAGSVSEEQSDSDDALLLAPLMSQIIDYLAVFGGLAVVAGMFLTITRLYWEHIGVRVHP